MAAISSTPTATTTLTPPSSSHGAESSWPYTGGSAENTAFEKAGPFPQDSAHKSPSSAQPGPDSYGSRVERAARKMHSADNLHSDRMDKPTDGATLLPPHAIESRTGRTSPSDWDKQGQRKNGDDHKRTAAQAAGPGEVLDENSKWIHRDKLARIESAELQAAGIFVPKPRAPSKQRRERSQPAAVRRGTDASEQSHTRSRKNSAVVEPRALETVAPIWDLRTPEEIAEEEESAYFATAATKGGSRIPVAKTSPAPIPADYLERGSPAARKQFDASDGEPLSFSKTRSRSDSSGGNQFGVLPAAKRSVTDMSPKKNAAGRKTSAPAKTATTPTRPKTRSGSSSGTRPSTRSGDKQPEGDPPWMMNSYQPDPRLPPDQQLLPTVARRLQQEKWEKEGKFGDVYDKEFRPLNDNVFLKPAEAEKSPTDETFQHELDEWPLKPEAAKSPNLRQGSYSTMPKISDKQPTSPGHRPRTPAAHPQSPQQLHHPQATQRLPEEHEEPERKEKGGCGCCLVM